MSLVEQVTFSGKYSVERFPGRSVTYVTERCVLKLDESGLVLTEIAPGIDLKKDILELIPWAPALPDGGPKLMDPAIFLPGPMRGSRAGSCPQLSDVTRLNVTVARSYA